MGVSDLTHFCSKYSDLLVDCRKPIAGSRLFEWVKGYLRKLNGIPWEQFGPVLKKGEWQFNNTGSIEQLFMLEQNVKTIWVNYLGRHQKKYCAKYFIKSKEKF